MSATDDRSFELTATVSFPTLEAHQYDAFLEKLSAAVAEVVTEYPTVVAFMVGPDQPPCDVIFGVRFHRADPRYIEDMADEILQRSVALIAEREGTKPVESEREASMLVVA